MRRPCTDSAVSGGLRGRAGQAASSPEKILRLLCDDMLPTCAQSAALEGRSAFTNPRPFSRQVPKVRFNVELARSRPTRTVSLQIADHRVNTIAYALHAFHFHLGGKKIRMIPLPGGTGLLTLVR